MHDVRMKGFRERADVETVEAFLEAHTRALAPEPVELLACAGRVLAEDVISQFDVPGFPRSAMDGYAVRGEDTFGASNYDQLSLEVLGLSLPGNPFEGSVGPRQAVRIMTGARVPEGADAVVMAEVCEEQDGRVAVRGKTSARARAYSRRAAACGPRTPGFWLPSGGRAFLVFAARACGSW